MRFAPEAGLMRVSVSGMSLSLWERVAKRRVRAGKAPSSGPSGHLLPEGEGQFQRDRQPFLDSRKSGRSQSAPSVASRHFPWRAIRSFREILQQVLDQFFFARSWDVSAPIDHSVHLTTPTGAIEFERGNGLVIMATHAGDLEDVHAIALRYGFRGGGPRSITVES